MPEQVPGDEPEPSVEEPAGEFVESEALASPPRAEPTSTRLIGHGVGQPQAPPVHPRLSPIKQTIQVGGDAPPKPPPPPEPPPSDPSGAPTMMAHPQPSAPAAPPEPAPPPPPPIDEQILEEARRKAAQIVQQAQEQATRAIEEAQQHIQNAEQQAREKGFEEGQAAGMEAGKQELAGAVAEFQKMYQQMIKERPRIVAAAEPELARLAIKVAERAIAGELKTNPDVIVGVVKEALSGIKDREEVVIRVNPADFEAAKKHQPDFEKMIEGLKKFEVLSEASMDPGGCVIETNLGNVDARFQTRWSAIQAAFEDLAQTVESEVPDGHGA